MILTCPKCKARFLVPDTAIGASGRGVRCGKCSHQWFCTPSREILKQAGPQEGPKPSGAPNFDQLMREASEAEAPPPPELKPVPAGSNLPAVRPRLPLKAMLAAGIMMALALTAGLADFFPRAIGLPGSHGLAFVDVTLHPEPQGPNNHTTLYTLEGTIRNTTQSPHRPPQVRLTLLDKNGVQLRHWWVPMRRGQIAPSENVPFSMIDIDIPKSEPLRLRLDMGNWLELALRPVQ